MDKITVYRFTDYEIRTDEQSLSRRCATREWIDRNGKAVASESEVEVPAKVVDPSGLTIGNYDREPPM